MRLFNWFKKKQIQAETPGNFPEVDSSQTIETSQFEEGYEIGIDKYLVSKKSVKEELPSLKIKAILSNKTLTVFLPSGDVVTNTDASKEMLLQVQIVSTEAAVKKIMLAEDLTVKEKEKVNILLDDEDIQEGLPEIVGTGEFNEKGGALYMNGIEVSIPKLLAKEILKAGEKETDDYYQSLKNFWCWCVLNPDPIAREDIFGFLERGDFKITKNGFFLGYRNVLKVSNSEPSQSKELVEFISSKYLTIKLKQKKSPKNYLVRKEAEGTYSIEKNSGATGETDIEIIGNLMDLYNGLSEMGENNYTDAYTQTMKIKIGEVVRMPREDCDNNPYADCSRGLHIKNKHYGNGSGDVSILVAVNPMNVVAVPNRNSNKMRVCEYMPLGVIEGKWENWVEDADTLELEGEYASEEVNKLQEMAKNAGVEEYKEIKLIPGGAVTLTQVASKLESYKKTLMNRVVEVK